MTSSSAQPPDDASGVTPRELSITPQGRVDRWHRKLLDLTLRNRLLNFRSTKQTIPLICHDAAALEDLLASGKQFKLVPIPSLKSEGDEGNAHPEESDETRELRDVQSAFEKRQLCADLDGEELSRRLTKIYRRSRNDLAEGGSNTLYLAIGFLKWKESPRDKRIYSAPLVLVPVRLKRRSANSPYYLAHHEDDVRFNATLIQKLKRDFDCDLTDLESTLPRDERGVDIKGVLEEIGERVRSLQDFEVVDHLTLATFSFAKYLMWKDLVDRSDQLELNRVVRHLVHDPEKAFQAAPETPMPSPEEMDQDFEPHQLIHPLDADSSQLAAVMAASQGHDFVLLGPPGTGKSQTITNMIAQCLAGGKTVLFVAEKTAALEVVHRRLRFCGLGDFCVELHSNKAERRKFLQQLDRAWQAERFDSNDAWAKANLPLKQARDRLNAYVRAMHQRRSNGWTAFEAIGALVSGASDHAPELRWDGVDAHDGREFARLEEAVDALVLAYPPVAEQLPMSVVTRAAWSMEWESNLLRQASRIPESVGRIRPVLEQFCRCLGIEFVDRSRRLVERLNELASLIVSDTVGDFRSTFDPQLEKLDSYLDRLDGSIERYDHAVRGCGARYDDEQLQKLDLDDLKRRWMRAGQSIWPLSWMLRRSVTSELQQAATFGIVDAKEDLSSLATLQLELKRIETNPLASRSHLFRYRFTEVARVRERIEKSRQMKRLLEEICDELVGSEEPPEDADALIKRMQHALAPLFERRDAPEGLLEAAREMVSESLEFDAARSGFLETAGGLKETAECRQTLAFLEDQSQRIVRQRNVLQAWTTWQKATQSAALLGLSPLVEAMQTDHFPAALLSERFRTAYVRWWLPVLIDSDPALREFQRHTHEDTVKRFREADRQARSEAVRRVRGGTRCRLPTRQEVPRKSEWGVLRHQLGLKRPSKSIRELITLMPESFSKLAPCLLMSPLSIAQYLPANQRHFDVVIFDEASQITTWDAIGAIARGRQTIIVGDPRQLPPTNFFANSNDDEDDETLQDYERDLESILDEAKASGMPVLQLNWHYRSRHESLIAFSNHHYYNDQLITFPAPETRDSAVDHLHLTDCRYDRGKTRTNRKEAERVVEEGLRRMRRWLGQPEEQRQSLGIVTFNRQQQTLIEDLFDQALIDQPELEWFFSDDRIEPTVVKNLENVQGDERDVMFFSITFGPDSSGNIPLTFGALNREGGERRLNVAITRAREELLVFCSFLSEELAAERSEARGVRDLKAFLAYAEGRGREWGARGRGHGGGFGSELESLVAAGLTERGWELVPQVGVSGFRIAMAVRDPKDDQRFIAGIECDGSHYRDSATARDRDLTRQQVLGHLGWTMLRIWSREWAYDFSRSLDRLDQELKRLAAGSDSTHGDG